MDQDCAGKCSHSKKYHVVRHDGKFACCKMDCTCMEYVAKPDQPATKPA